MANFYSGGLPELRSRTYCHYLRLNAKPLAIPIPTPNNKSRFLFECKISSKTLRPSLTTAYVNDQYHQRYHNAHQLRKFHLEFPTPVLMSPKKYIKKLFKYFNVDRNSNILRNTKTKYLLSSYQPFCWFLDHSFLRKS